MPFHDLEKEYLEEKCLEWKQKNDMAHSVKASEMASIYHALLVRKEREESLEALIYKLAEAVGVDLDNLEEK